MTSAIEKRMVAVMDHLDGSSGVGTGGIAILASGSRMPSPPVVTSFLTGRLVGGDVGSGVVTSFVTGRLVGGDVGSGIITTILLGISTLTMSMLRNCICSRTT